MKLKTIVTPVLAACMAFGVCFSAAACGEKPHEQHSGGTWEHDANNHWKICAVCGEKYLESEHHFTNGVCECGQTEEPEAPKTTEYSVSIEGITASGGLNVLFYNSKNSRISSITDMKASAELPTGEYVAYIIGTMAGYIYTPVKVNAMQPEGIIKAEAATPNADGEVPYQVLYMLSADKIFEGDFENDIGQICTTGESGQCYSPRFNEFHIAALNIAGTDLFRLPKGKHQIHMPSGSEILDNYTLPEDKYLTQDSGGFCSIILESLL